MKLLTIITLCVFIMGCAVLSTVSYKDMMYVPAMSPDSPAESSSEHGGHGFPRPAPAPVSEESVREDYIRAQESMRTEREKQPKISTPVASYPRKVPTIEEATEQVSEQLFKTSAAITGDTIGSIEDTLNITLTIDPSLDKESLRQQLESENPDAKITVTDTKISALAWPELIAPDFTVTPAVASEQAVIKDGPTEWSWQLKPKTGGKFIVLIDLYAIVYVGDKQTKRKYKTLRQPITITVPEISWYIHLWNWVDQNWEWIWTVILLPAIGYLINKRRKKKKKR
jgi:hypothetical protein